MGKFMRNKPDRNLDFSCLHIPVYRFFQFQLYPEIHRHFRVAGARVFALYFAPLAIYTGLAG